jgi:hypothetical protein
MDTTAHTAGETMDLFRNVFPGHLISCCGDIQWPSQCLDLSAPDYFLWGCHNKKVSLQELKNRINKNLKKLTEIQTCCSV